MATKDALDLVRGVLPVRPNTEVSHYTSMATLPKLVREGGWRSVWCTSVRFMNDREEYAIGARAIRNESDILVKTGLTLRAELDGALRPLDPDIPLSGVDVYATSLSSNVDELSRWRGYGDDGRGVSLVTMTASLDSMCRDDEIAGHVVYGEAEHADLARRLLEKINTSNLDGNDVLTALQVGAVFLKDKGFAVEQEFRFVRVVASDSSEVKNALSSDFASLSSRNSKVPRLL